MIWKPAPRFPHARAAAELAESLGSDPARGLSEAEAARRLAETGPNELPLEGGKSPWRILLAQFENVLIAILIVALALSVTLGRTVEAVVIGVITLMSVALGFVQEFRAERALEALRRLASPDATVLRDGRERDIPSRELVPGDLVMLGAGDVVPADGRLVEAVNLRSDEAALTGESSPVTKDVGPLPDQELPLGDRRNMVYASTSMTCGRGRAIVVATGSGTEVGKVGELLRTVREEETPLEENLRRLGRALAWGAGAVVLLIAALGLFRGRPLPETIIFGIALAVAVVPEALPAVLTISLALGARRMVRRHALVRHLPAIETLGCVTVICSDKTGTLTTGEMTVRELYADGRTVHVTGAGYEPRGTFREGQSEVRPGPVFRGLLETAALSTDAHLVQSASDQRWSVRGDPTEGALVVAAAKAGIWKAPIEAELPRTGEIPFSAERKRMTTLHAGPGGPLSISKGAPEVILGSCASVLRESGASPLDAATRERILSAAREMAGRALRVLAVARREGPDLGRAEEGMTFLGLLGMIDPPRPQSRAATEACLAAGIRPVMITGDHPATARAIALELGFLRNGGVVTGAEIEEMCDADLERRADEIDVYARASPAHKLRIVTALQRRGEVIAVTGDGVNDGPALKKSDVGIAMGIVGTDVAKGAAAVILTDDDFSSIVAAVEEGRAIFDNVKKYLMYLLSSNVGEVLLMAGALLAGLPLPLAAVQVLYVNLATDGLPALALAFDPPATDLMRRRPRRVKAGVFTGPVAALILIGGAWSGFVNVSLFAWTLTSGRSLAESMTMAFTSLVLIEFLKAYCFRSERRSILRNPFGNRWLNLAIAWELLLLAGVLYVPFLERAFGTVPLTVVDWSFVLATAFSVVPVLEAAKGVARRTRTE